MKQEAHALQPWVDHVLDPVALDQRAAACTAPGRARRPSRPRPA